MKTIKNMPYYLTTGLLVILSLLLLYETTDVAVDFYKEIPRYKWVGAGIVAFALFHYYVKKNRDWFETFSHELTHALVAIACLREITSFQVNKRDGVVWSTTGRWGPLFEPSVSLAPYCLPIFTYGMLFLWSLVANYQLVVTDHLWGFDTIVGITIAFHFFCFRSQTNSQQNDINKFPTVFSYTYIWFFRLFNLLIILLCYLPGEKKEDDPRRLWGAFFYLAKEIWKIIISFF